MTSAPSDVLSLVAEVRAKPGKDGELESVLRGLLAPTRREEGCLNYDLHRAQDDPGFFVLYENWRTTALWERHMETPHLAAFMARTDELVADWTLHRLTRIG
jgi:quinol monooxygenase YgiN